MKTFRYIFGPVPSRRLGQSLGVSPIPEGTCNYSCTYCQLGRTRHMTNRRQCFFPLNDILQEFDQCLDGCPSFDVVTVVGEGEPTLYADLGPLIHQLKQRTEKPVAVITNGALLSDGAVRQDLMEADIVLPSLDAVDQNTFRAIDRPYGTIRFDEVWQGLKTFSKEYTGQIYLEIMLLDQVNCSEETILQFKEMLKQLRYDRLYVNAPVRPPAEKNVYPASPEQIDYAVKTLGGISIDMLTTGSFASEIDDPLEAIISIAKRHPMNQFEIKSFLESRDIHDPTPYYDALSRHPHVSVIDYKGIRTYRAH